MSLVIALFLIFLGFQIWSVRAYIDFIASHPEIEKRLIDSALRQSC